MIEVKEMKLVEADKVRELRYRAEVSDSLPDFIENGMAIQWVLEFLDLLEDD